MLRPPSCAGSVYPDEPAALRAALDAWLGIQPRRAGASPASSSRPPSRTARASSHHPPSPPARAGGEGRGEGVQERVVGEGVRGEGDVRLVLAPHIDYPRGAAGYARAYSALAATDADLFVVLGTAHATPLHLFTLTRDDFATPLGRVTTDRPAVDAIAAQVGEHEVLADARCHAEEHSIELQLVVLEHLVRHPFTIVPVLCSSIAHLDEPAHFTARFLDALRRAVAGRKACFIASADLAHVGPGYGDPRPPTRAELAWLEAEDRRTLGFLEAGDAEGFHRAATREDQRRRLCGIAPTYAAMRAAGRGARLLHYERWTDGRDSVSFAAAAG